MLMVNRADAQHIVKQKAGKRPIILLLTSNTQLIIGYTPTLHTLGLTHHTLTSIYRPLCQMHFRNTLYTYITVVGLIGFFLPKLNLLFYKYTTHIFFIDAKIIQLRNMIELHQIEFSKGYCLVTVLHWHKNVCAQHQVFWKTTINNPNIPRQRKSKMINRIILQWLCGPSSSSGCKVIGSVAGCN